MTAALIADLILFGLAVVRAGSVLVHPSGRRWLRRGKGKIRRKGSRRAPKCQLCKGLKAPPAPRHAHRPPDPR